MIRDVILMMLIHITLPIHINPPADIVYNRKVSLKNSAPFFNCTLKINNQLIEDAQDVDIVNPMCNLFSYSKDFRNTTGSFWNYYPDKPSSGYIGANNERTRVYYPIRNPESFNYKTKLICELPGANDAELNNIKMIIPLKNLSNFIFSLDFSMTNTEIELILK